MSCCVVGDTPCDGRSGCTTETGNDGRSSGVVHSSELFYLDNTGSALPGIEQINAFARDMSANTVLFANPHTSPRCAEEIARARVSVLEQFNASPADYDVIFTSGTTAALKLVGECFPWTERSNLAFVHFPHNSALGIRAYATAAGASVSSHKTIDTLIESLCPKSTLTEVQGTHTLTSNSVPATSATLESTNNLAVLIAECNFSGERYDLQDINRLHSALPSFKVLLDAAAFVPHSKLDLSLYMADFVTLSFYKIFGYPTGLGALIVHKRASRLLKKKYFGGGTVSAALWDSPFVALRESIPESLEDGTPSFMSIAALRHGWRLINGASIEFGGNTVRGIEALDLHTHQLAMYLYDELSSLKHWNGSPVCVFAGRLSERDIHKQGPVVTFSVKQASGAFVGHQEVGRVCELNGVLLRTGCMCNPGACQNFLGLTSEQVLQNWKAGHVCWMDGVDLVQGRPTGAIRASFGWCSTKREADKLVSVIRSHFIEDKFPNPPATPPDLRLLLSPVPANELRVSAIYVYPIKSCAGFAVARWQCGSEGLLYDREWVIVGADNRPLIQKKLPSMCFIHTTISLENNLLRVEAPGMAPLIIPLSETDAVINESASSWLSSFLKCSCKFVRASVHTGNKEATAHNSANFLVISDESLRDLRSRLPEAALSTVHMRNFRPNIVISGGEPFQEDNWKTIKIGENLVLSHGGLCNRCTMTCIDPQTGTVYAEPLRTLATFRRINGGLMFGTLMNIQGPPSSVAIGDPIVLLP
ncbi:molybdenum cofactor sulfurase [Pelomyxa schiedti]|nr:molybdenum cofactor sulfurase [Pelomyxa schiedti]